MQELIQLTTGEPARMLPGVYADIATRRTRPKRPLGPVLDTFLARSDFGEAVRRDPVEIVHAVRERADREVAAFLAAALAFGQVTALKAKVRAALDALGPHPAHALRSLGADELRDRLRGFRHRWLGGDDLALLLAGAGAALRVHGSLERAFASGLDPRDPHVGPALSRFSAALRAAIPGPLTPGLRFALPSPDTGSACKRLCLFLRWVARPADGVDLGLWTSVPPAKLVIPLDTHIARISRYIGLTRRKSPGWAMALDVTAHLRRLAPDDPLRYDFALCHLGISGRCPKHRVAAICKNCEINEICRLPRCLAARRP
jgi:uncharacterized protein (TIGR02757 family)